MVWSYVFVALYKVYTHICVLCVCESGKYIHVMITKFRKLNGLYHSNMAMFATDAAVCTVRM